MSMLKDFADSLHEEVITEMAQTYFGERKNVDDMIVALHGWVVELKKMERDLAASAGRLHYLLVNRDLARQFYIALDVVPHCIPLSFMTPPKPLFINYPFGLTSRMRYTNYVLEAYHLFERDVDRYINGEYYTEPGSKRKRLTIHYLRVKALCEYVNEAIDKVNTRLSPSATLNYLRAMESDESKIGGLDVACNGKECALDRDMRFNPIEFSSLGLREIQELPQASKVRGAIKDYCRWLWKEHRDKVLQTLPR